MRHPPVLGLLLLLLLALSERAPAAQGNDANRLFLPLLGAPLAFTASYLGGPAADSISAAGFARDGQLLLAGSWPGYAPSDVTPTTLLNGGDGAILRLRDDGSRLTSLVRLGAVINDMEVGASGSVVACGDFGVAVLQADLGALLWSQSPGVAKRCAIGVDGSVATSVGQNVYHYDPAGGAPTSWVVGGTALADIAIDDAQGLVFATGYTQKSSNLKVAFLRAYGFDGTVRWTAYDFAASTITGINLAADSEGRRVAMGRDGSLLFAGYADGGNAIYGRDPQNIARSLSNSELITFDTYNNPFNISGAKALAWYGRFDPATGRLDRGQWLLTRLNDGKGNSVSIKAIDAAADGTVIVTGDSACCLPNRASMQLNGVTLGSYELGEAFVLVTSADLTKRRLWTALAAPGTSAGGSPANAAAIGSDRIAVGLTFNPRSSTPQRGLLTSAGALQPGPTGNSDGYFLIMPRP